METLIAKLQRRIKNARDYAVWCRQQAEKCALGDDDREAWEADALTGDGEARGWEEELEAVEAEEASWDRSE